MVEARDGRSDSILDAESPKRAELERLLKDGRYEEVMELLHGARWQAPHAPEISRGIQLVKQRLIRDYLASIGSLDRVPRQSDGVRPPVALTDEEGALLRLVDGISSFGDIARESRFGQFETYRMLARFLEARVITAPPERQPNDGDVTRAAGRPGSSAAHVALAARRAASRWRRDWRAWIVVLAAGAAAVVGAVSWVRRAPSLGQRTPRAPVVAPDAGAAGSIARSAARAAAQEDATESHARGGAGLDAGDGEEPVSAAAPRASLRAVSKGGDRPRERRRGRVFGAAPAQGQAREVERGLDLADTAELQGAKRTLVMTEDAAASSTGLPAGDADGSTGETSPPPLVLSTPPAAPPPDAGSTRAPAVTSLGDAVPQQLPPAQPSRAPVAAAAPARPYLAADVRIENVVARGSLSRAVITRALARVAPALRTCYAAAAKRAERDAAGSLDLRLVIDETGVPRDVVVTGSLLPGLDACVRDAAASARSPAPDVGDARVTFTVAFRPSSTAENR